MLVEGHEFCEILLAVLLLIGCVGCGLYGCHVGQKKGEIRWREAFYDAIQQKNQEKERYQTLIRQKEANGHTGD